MALIVPFADINNLDLVLDNTFRVHLHTLTPVT